MIFHIIYTQMDYKNMNGMKFFEYETRKSRMKSTSKNSKKKWKHVDGNSMIDNPRIEA